MKSEKKSLIRMEGLGKVFLTDEVETHALADIHLEIWEGEFVAVAGPSGCGKTTLLRCFNRVNERYGNVRTTGEIHILDQDIYAPDVSLVELRKAVGMVFQRPNPFPQSVYNNVAFGPRVLGTGKDENLDAIVESSLRGAALWDEVKDNLKQDALGLSLGQQQRLCIARTIAVKPEVILMDEPCSALDPIATLEVEELMHTLKENYSIVIVTHNMQQAARVSDWTGFFWLGEMVEFDATETIFTNPGHQLTEGYITGRAG